jgi:signal transduction histidine kinase
MLQTKNTSLPLPRVPKLLLVLAALTTGIVLFETAWSLFGAPTFSANLWLFLSVYPLTAVVMVWVARCHAEVRQRQAQRGWLLTSVIPLLMLAGDFGLYWLELRGLELFPSWATLCYFAIFAWFFVAYRNFSGRRPPSVLVWQRRLDVAICVWAVGVYMWRFVYSPIALSYAANPVTLAVFVFSILVLIIPVSIVAMTVWSGETLQGVHRFTLMLALVGYALLIVSFFMQHHQGVYSTNNINANLSLWILVLFTASALLGLRPERGRTYSLLRSYSLLHSGRYQLRRVLPYLPYAAMLASFALLFDPAVARQVREGGITLKMVVEGAGLLAGSSVITLLVVARQLLTIRENLRLHRELQAFSSDLEKRVSERTKELEDSRERLVSSERLASLGRVSAGLAHEINTPVAAAMNSLQQAIHLAQEYQDSVGNPDVSDADHREIARELRHSLATTNNSLDRLGEFVRRMRNQVRSSAGKNDFEVVRVTKDSLAMLEHRARKAKVQLLFSEPSSFYFYGDAARFSQVVSNLVVNALDACEDDLKDNSAVTVSLLSTHQGLTLEVTDNGVGIPQDMQQKIFEPLFTTKELGKGTGLGLAIIQDIVYSDFDGRIELESQLGRGTCFRVLLPNKKQTVFDEVRS